MFVIFVTPSPWNISCWEITTIPVTTAADKPNLNKRVTRLPDSVLITSSWVLRAFFPLTVTKGRVSIPITSGKKLWFLDSKRILNRRSTEKVPIVPKSTFCF